MFVSILSSFQSCPSPSSHYQPHSLPNATSALDRELSEKNQPMKHSTTIPSPSLNKATFHTKTTQLSKPNLNTSLIMKKLIFLLVLMTPLKINFWKKSQCLRSTSKNTRNQIFLFINLKFSMRRLNPKLNNHLSMSKKPMNPKNKTSIRNLLSRPFLEQK